MRVLFQVTATTFLRHFTDVVLTLAARGHAVRVAHSENPPDLPPPAALKDNPRISFVDAPAAGDGPSRAALTEVRALRDYLVYLHGAHDAAPKLRGRALRKAIKTLSGDTHRHLGIECPHCHHAIEDDSLVQALRARYPLGPAGLAERLATIEAAVPADGRVEAFLRKERPDVVVVTPLIWIGSQQAEYVKSAQALGIPVAYAVFSWDNLSTKGAVHVQPDRVLVWNDRQKQEAMGLHRVPEERVVVTGAPRFDRFFAMTPQTSRTQFCEANSLDPAQPIVTYLCSSEFVAEVEREFVMRWADEVRRHPALAACNIVIRPHPRYKAQWKKFDTGHPRVAVALPASISTDQSLFDTMHHSAAVVGLNTSAQLEAGIVGRPVLTILAPEFAGGQAGTLHFRYLLKEEGGFVDVAQDFEQHRAQLADAVAGRYDAAQIRRFIDGFLRPLGRDRAVSPIMADTIEALARKDRRSWWPGWRRGLRLG
jgi:hypothetical protein